MPLDSGYRFDFRKGSKNRILRIRDGDLVNADLGLGSARYFTTHARGEKLGTKAKTQDWDSSLDRILEKCSFSREPRRIRVVKRSNRSTERNDRDEMIIPKQFLK